MRKIYAIVFLIAFFSLSCAKEVRGKFFVDVNGEVCNPLEVKESKKANVLCFTTTDCPIANGYSQRFNQLKEKYSKLGFDFYLIHIDWETTQESALKHMKDYELNLRVLLDPKHQLVKRTGVTITPEVAVLMPDDSIAYKGRIDNWYEGFGKKRNVITKTELSDALDAIHQGDKVVVTHAKAVGCSIPNL